MARSAEHVAQQVIDLRLVEPDDVRRVVSDLGHDASPEDLLQAMLRQNLLTRWQVERIKKDYSVGFFYGDYKLLYLAGAGTFARVYRASHRQTGEIVAVKVLRTRHADDGDVVSHFIREGQVGKKLRHPNIVAVYAHGEENHTHYIVMEFVEGGSLREFVRQRKRVDPIEATELIIQVVGALKYAHQKGFAHRDMKMTNVLLSATGVTKLIDFGLAAGPGEGVPRTVEYAALERAGGGPRDDPRSDLYFAGCMYYHLLAGEPPLKEVRSRAERGARSRFLNVTPIQHMGTGLPQHVGEIVDRAMHVSVEVRYQSAAQMLIDLNRSLDRLKHRADQAAASDRDDTPQSTGTKRPVMIVESDPTTQDLLRDGLKRSGYRVLITSDPFRALERFEEVPDVAECVVFSAETIGPSVIEAFNQFAENERTRDIPAILLLGQDQREWRHQARLDQAHRTFLTMPIKLKALRAVLARLLSSEVAEEES